MPSTTRALSPTSHKAHLLTTLHALESQRDDLITSLLPYLPPASPSIPPSTTTSPPPSTTATTTTLPASTMTTPPSSTTNPRTPPLHTTTTTTTAHALAKSTVETHIRALHTYNTIRDAAQGMFGLIADQRGVRVVDVMSEFGVGAGD